MLMNRSSLGRMKTLRPHRSVWCLRVTASPAPYSGSTKVKTSLNDFFLDWKKLALSILTISLMLSQCDAGTRLVGSTKSPSS